MDISNALNAMGFPNLLPGTYVVTSQIATWYNCIAWAAGDNRRWWWPLPSLPWIYWPPNAPRQETLAAFVSAFGSLGYQVCTDGQLEDGIEKIAIFADTSGKPTHAARQLADGWWTSKLGKFIDISHTITGLDGPKYGSVVTFMSRVARAVPRK